MNNYIINPSWFYIADVLTRLNILSVVGLLASLVVYTLFEFLILVDGDITEENELALMKKTRNISGLIFLISTLMVVFIPSKETFISMKLAEFATYENVEIISDKIKNAADYIIQQLK